MVGKPAVCSSELEADHHLLRKLGQLWVCGPQATTPKAWPVACYDPLVKSTAGPGILRAGTKVTSERDPHSIGLGCSLVEGVPV